MKLTASVLLVGLLAPANAELDTLAMAAIAGLCGLGLSTVKVVTTGNEALVERFGKFHRKLGAGWHCRLPLLEAISMEQTTREQVLDVPPQQCYTKDNAPIKADAVVYLKIKDMEASRYQVNDVFNAILNLVLTQIREEMGKITLDETFSSRAKLNEALLNDVNAATGPWGVEITRIEVLNIDPSPDILKAMELQMAAERRKRAAILTSEGERATLTNEAEGNAAAVVANAEAARKAKILQATAECERLKIEAKGLKEAIQELAAVVKRQGGRNDKDAMDAALSLLMLRTYLDTQGRFARGNGTKVLMFPSKDTVPVTYDALSKLLQ